MYKKADYTLSGNTIRITLPYQSSSGEMITLFLAYRTSDFIQSDFAGNYTYDFKTLKTDSGVATVQVGISTEQNYVLKDAIGYQSYTNQSTLGIMKSEELQRRNEIVSYQLDDLVNNIGYGSLNKTGNNIAPMESFSVKGAYASSIWRLYAKPLLIGLIVVILCIVIGIIVLFKVIKTVRAKRAAHVDSSPHMGLLSELQKKILFSYALSFLSSVGIAGHTAISFVIHSFFITRLSYDYTITTFLTVLLFSFSVCMYIGFILVPVLFMGIKKGLLWGLITFISTILWLLLYLVIVIIIIFIFFSGGGTYPPIKY
jgi:hypothetical protein